MICQGITYNQGAYAIYTCLLVYLACTYDILDKQKGFLHQFQVS